MESNKIFFFKGTDLLINIRNSKPTERYALKLSKTINLGYARVNQILTLFKQLGLIEFIDLDKRTKGIRLTKKGEEIADNLIAIMKKINT
ncbi:MAG: hypothetical protein NT076_05230 [Candidatus Pacearchaeota archaeon]|nr:hypothetical protein [Candidatus Pacearchaeota archaeon]